MTHFTRISEKPDQNVKIINHDDTSTIMEFFQTASSTVTDHVAGRTVVATDGVFTDNGTALTALGGGGGGGSPLVGEKVPQSEINTYWGGPPADSNSDVTAYRYPGSQMAFLWDAENDYVELDLTSLTASDAGFAGIVATPAHADFRLRQGVAAANQFHAGVTATTATMVVSGSVGASISVGGGAEAAIYLGGGDRTFIAINPGAQPFSPAVPTFFARVVAGKQQMCVIFSDGTIVVLAAQP